MAKQWIDFKELKRRLDFAEVLKHYGVVFKVKGEQASGHCPLPTHESDGKSPSFSAQLKKGIWQCFSPGCRAKGNVLDFAVRMEGLSPDKPQDVRTVALKLRDQFGLEIKVGASNHAKATNSSNGDQGGGDDSLYDSGSQLPGAERPNVIANQPLDFQLKGLDAKHPYLKDRGFSPQTIERFGLGFASRGMLKGRIAIPIHDEADRLVGYAGRLVDDSQVTKSNPKYKFPPARERNGVIHEFHKSKLLYNANRILAPATTLIVVEGFASVWWLYQWGFRDAVALMGSDCSPEQAEIIIAKVPPDGLVLVMPDGNEAGERCAVSAFETVGTQHSLRWIKLDNGRQPTDCTDEELFRLLEAVS